MSTSATALKQSQTKLNKIVQIKPEPKARKKMSAQARANIKAGIARAKALKGEKQHSLTIGYEARIPATRSRKPSLQEVQKALRILERANLL